MKIYIIECMDSLTTYGSKEIQFICETKEDALKIIKDNSCDFQDHAWRYCMLKTYTTNNYAILSNYENNTNNKPTYYKFNHKLGEWVKMNNDEIKLELNNDIPYEIFGIRMNTCIKELIKNIKGE